MPRLERLRRISAIYQLIEESCLIEFRRATAELVMVERTLHIERNALRSARTGEQDAVRNEDMFGRIAMAAQMEIANRKKHRLEILYQKKQLISDEAEIRLQESRLWNERLKMLIEHKAEDVAKLDAKKLQAALDDRFLSLDRRSKKKIR